VRSCPCGYQVYTRKQALSKIGPEKKQSRENALLEKGLPRKTHPAKQALPKTRSPGNRPAREKALLRAGPPEHNPSLKKF